MAFPKLLLYNYLLKSFITINININSIVLYIQYMLPIGKFKLYVKNSRHALRINITSYLGCIGILEYYISKVNCCKDNDYLGKMYRSINHH